MVLLTACAHVGVVTGAGGETKFGTYEGTGSGVPPGQLSRLGSRLPGGYGGPYVLTSPMQRAAMTCPSTDREAPLDPPEHFVHPLLVHARTSEVDCTLP